MWCSKGWWIIALITRYRLLLVLFVGPLKPFFGLLVMSPLGFKAKVGSLIHIWCRCMCYIFNEIHLWCDTCHHGGQYGSQAVLFHIPVSRHWWGSKPESIVSPLPHSVRPGRCSTNRIMLARPDCPWFIQNTSSTAFCFE